MKTPLLPVVLSAVLLTNLHSAELARDGATKWKIVLPDEPTIIEKTAVRELSEHLELVTGADFQTPRPGRLARGMSELYCQDSPAGDN